MSLVLNSASGGSITLDEPATAVPVVQTLAAANGTLAPIVSGTAQASTSGTSRDFTGIPSWAKRITVMFAGVSTSGSSFKRVQLGTSGGIDTTGYLGSNSQNNIPAVSTDGIDIASNAAGDVIHGALTLVNVNGNTWVANYVLGKSDAGMLLTGASSKTLSGTLDRIRITTVNGTDTFDAGTVNIMWE